MNSRISIITKVIAGICALALVAVIFLPIWRIELSAPQYPEGLVLQIYAGKLGGDVEIVNGLNHYIGMRTLHTKDFVEFAVLPWIIGTFVLFGCLSVIINRRWFYLTWVGFFILFAITAMIDFYRWEYNYGHNLDPAAPIQVPGMTYQPPLIGYKELLNFGAYSIPDAGGWIFIAVGLVLVVTAFSEIRKMRRAAKHISLKMAAVLLIGMISFSGCSQGPQPIVFGTDACDYCKMTITDKRFGGELVTKKGKVYKFDDIHCITSFLKSNTKEKATAGIYLVDFSQPGQLSNSTGCFLYSSDQLRSPMGSNILAVSRQDELEKIKGQFSGKVIKWEDVQ